MVNVSLPSVAAFAVAALPFVSAAPTPVPASNAFQAESASNMGNIVSDNYIIKLKENTTDEQFQAHTAWAAETHFKNRLVKRDGKNLTGEAHQYNFGGFRGYAGAYDSSTIEAIKGRDEVDYVEEDKIVVAYGMGEQDSVPSWGLARVSSKEPGNTSTYYYDSSSGSGVTVYVIDTGVETDHIDFGGRASFGYNAAGDGSEVDGVGHGTHVAGTIAGETFGIAKKASIVAVKVLGKDGSGTNSGVIAGVQWVTQDARKKGSASKSVANMSLGGSLSQALNSAVQQAISSGITFAVAAGNDGKDASGYSPASVEEAITVGATGKDDTRATYSNYGQLVDVFAPGTDITSCWSTCKNCKNTISGTSMASPHVAGMAAYLIGMGKASGPSNVRSMIQQIANQVVQNPGQGTTDGLLYNASGH